MPNWPLKAGEIAELVEGEVEGDESLRLGGLAGIAEAGPEHLTFAADARRAGAIEQSRAAAAIVADAPAESDKTLIRVRDVQQALVKLLAAVAPPEDLPPEGVDPTASVSEQARVAPDARIGPGVVVGSGATVGAQAVLCAGASVGADASVGEKTHLSEGVVIAGRCVVGNRVRIGPNSVVGSDGFGYHTVDGVHHRVPHTGNVVIEDDVEIGACTCVDRAKFGSTRIGAGTKIDNLVQVAHNVQVGRGCLLTGQVGLAGSARLGDYVVLGGNAGVRDNVSLGDGAQCAAYSAVAADVPAGAKVAGIPAGPAREQIRIVTAQAKLPELVKRLRDLEARVRTLESSEDH